MPYRKAMDDYNKQLELMNSPVIESGGVALNYLNTIDESFKLIKTVNSSIQAQIPFKDIQNTYNFTSNAYEEIKRMSILNLGGNALDLLDPYSKLIRKYDWNKRLFPAFNESIKIINDTNTILYNSTKSVYTSIFEINTLYNQIFEIIDNYSIDNHLEESHKDTTQAYDKSIFNKEKNKLIEEIKEFTNRGLLNEVDFLYIKLFIFEILIILFLMYSYSVSFNIDNICFVGFIEYSFEEIVKIRMASLITKCFTKIN